MVRRTEEGRREPGRGGTGSRTYPAVTHGPGYDLRPAPVRHSVRRARSDYVQPALSRTAAVALLVVAFLSGMVIGLILAPLVLPA